MVSLSPEGAPERELKFQLRAGARERLSRHPALSEPGRRSHLRSVYFDTPEHDLRNSGLSLRVREKDGQFVQTVKSRHGVGLIDRDEWEAPVAGGAPDLDVLARTPAGEVLNGAGAKLSPLFESRVERTVRLWDDGRNIIEVALDEGEVVAGDQREALEELELELRAGDPAALFELAEQLAAEAPMTLSFESKSERGYRLAGHDGAARIRAEQAAVNGAATVEAAFRQIARGCLSRIAANGELLEQAPSPVLVHQTRVNVRRLRASLSVFRHMLDAPGLARAKDDLRWLSRALDAAREIDVFEEKFFPGIRDAAPDDANLTALHRRLQEARAEAYERASEAAGSQRFSDLLLHLTAWIEVGAWTVADDDRLQMLRRAPLPAFGAAMLDHLRRRVRRMGRGLAEQDDEGRHRLRLKVKKLRYATEFFESAFPKKRRRRYLEDAKALQESLGALNDLATARETALRIVGPRASELAFTAGALVGSHQAAVGGLIKTAKRAYEELAEAEPFWRG